MGQIEDIEQKLVSANAKLGLLNGSVVSIRTDIQNLKAKIDTLMEGSITKEQLDALSAASGSIADKIDSVAADLSALDAETPNAETPVAPENT